MVNFGSFHSSVTSVVPEFFSFKSQGGSGPWWWWQNEAWNDAVTNAYNVHMYVYFQNVRSGQTTLLKAGSLDNAIQEFSLAKPSWYMSNYTTLYKYGKRTHYFLDVFIFLWLLFLFFGDVHTSLAIYDLMSNVRLWCNCELCYSLPCLLYTLV